MDAIKDLTDKVQHATETLTEQVKEALPLDKDMMEKLTLTTPEMAAERQKIDEEERRKEYIKDSLASMLPWETRDTERDILVEECKEAYVLQHCDGLGRSLLSARTNWHCSTSFIIFVVVVVELVRGSNYCCCCFVLFLRFTTQHTQAQSRRNDIQRSLCSKFR